MCLNHSTVSKVMFFVKIRGWINKIVVNVKYQRLKLLFQLLFCGMMYTEVACGELWSRWVSDDAVCTVNRLELIQGQESNLEFLTLEYGTSRLSRNVGRNRCVIIQKITVLREISVHNWALARYLQIVSNIFIDCRTALSPVLSWDNNVEFYHIQVTNNYCGKRCPQCYCWQSFILLVLKLPFSWTMCCHTTKESAFTLMKANKLKLGNRSVFQDFCPVRCNFVWSSANVQTGNNSVLHRAGTVWKCRLVTDSFQRERGQMYHGVIIQTQVQTCL
jgi:hypothetical protein